MYKKRTLIEIINKSTEELHQKIDVYHCLMVTILEKKVGEKRLNQIIFPNSHRELRLKEAIKETIEVLEDTRKAFKSKQLEALRKKLTHALID